MAHALACSKCQKRLQVDERLIGKRVRCPACQTVLLVPGPAAVPAPLAPAARPPAPPLPQAATAPAADGKEGEGGTAFQAVFLHWRRQQNFTPADLRWLANQIIADGFGKLGCFILTVIVAGVALWWGGSKSLVLQWILVGFAVITFVMAIQGLIGIARGLLKHLSGLARSVPVQCPRCHKEQNVFDVVRDYPCSACACLMFRKRGDRQLMALDCPHCGNRFGVGPGRDRVRCPDCALELAVTDAGTRMVESRREPCPHCHKPVPAGAALCSFCRRCFPSALEGKEGVDCRQRLGKSPIGHLIHAASLLTLLEKTWAQKRTEPIRMKELTPWLPFLPTILEELEEASADSKLRPAVREAFRRLESCHRAVVQGLWQVLTTNGAKCKHTRKALGCLIGPSDDLLASALSTQDKKFHFDRWTGLPVLRDRVVARLQSGTSEQALGSSRWEMPLVTFAMEPTRIVFYDVMERFVVNDVAGLVKQLEAWGEKPDPRGLPVKPPPADSGPAAGAEKKAAS